MSTDISPQNLIDTIPALSSVILVYGPAALLILNLFFVERRLRMNIESSNETLSSISAKLYPIDWAVAAVLGIAVCVLSGYTFFFGDTVIRGSFEGLTTDYQLDVIDTSRAGGRIYISRMQLTPKRYDYNWLLYVNGSLSDASRIKFEILKVKSQSPEADAREITIPIECIEESSRNYITIQYNGSDSATAICGSKHLNLPAKGYSDTQDIKDVPSPRSTSGLLFFGIGAAYAQDSDVDPSQYRDALISPSVMIRKEARESLAAVGSRAVPWIEKALLDPNSPHDLILGVVVALIKMPDQSQNAVSDEAMKALVEAAVGNDVVLRYNARVYLRNHGSDGLIAYMENELTKAPSDSSGSLQPARQGYLARALLDIRYKRGITQVFQFRDGPRDESLIANAIANFSGGWAYSKWGLTGPGTDVGERKVQFAKSLWGLGIAYHEDYWNKLSNAKLNDADLRKRGVDAFKQLIEVADVPDYQYPTQVLLAINCLKTFEQSCIEANAQ